MKPESKFRCWAEIDLAALERNLGSIRSALPSHIRYIAVVKADAYGHGLYQTVARLMQCGADIFAVANVYEGAEIREIGSGWPILILSPLLPEEDRYLLDYNLTPTLSSPEELKRYNALGKKAGRRLPIHLKIDTGMGRIGVWYEQAVELYRLVQKAQNVELQGAFTHFSSAATDPEYTSHQRKLFLETINRFSPGGLTDRLIHADNSAGLETLSPESPFNAVRVGLLQFGVSPYPDSMLSRVNAEPVLSFHTRVGLVKNLPAGTSISYGRTCQLARASKVAILTAGYGDGIPTSLSNKGQVIIRGQRCPILGAVTMDQTMIDVTDLGRIEIGEQATLIGSQGQATITASQFSTWSKDIPWEIFCSITKRVPRVYRTARSI